MKNKVLADCGLYCQSNQQSEDEKVLDLIDKFRNCTVCQKHDGEIRDKVLDNLRLSILIGIDKCLLRPDYINAKRYVDKAFAEFQQSK